MQLVLRRVHWQVKIQPTAISTITNSGFTARMISKHRPVCRLLRQDQVWRQLNLVWGCKPILHTAKHTKRTVLTQQ